MGNRLLTYVPNVFVADGVLRSRSPDYGPWQELAMLTPVTVVK